MSPEIKLALPALAKMLSLANIEPAFSSPKKPSHTVGNDGKMQRLVDYNTRVLERYIKKIVVNRKNCSVSKNVEKTSLDSSVQYTPSSTSVREEAMNHDVAFPFGGHHGTTHHHHHHSLKDSAECSSDNDGDHIELGSKVKAQLRHLVNNVAGMYRDLPFHCFEHASHTILSVTKLLTAVEATATTNHKRQTQVGYQKSSSSLFHHDDDNDETLVDMMTCDRILHPMTQFSIVFAALVHDMDYEIPNTQLIKEESTLASKYNNQSIAEQNSIDRAWSLFMETSKYKDLRECIFATQDELDGFRSLLVKSIIATDLWDKELVNSRRQRWNDTFVEPKKVTIHKNIDEPKTLKEMADQRAWIAVEHLIQVSDVSHTLQPLNVFLKWNKLLFKEMYLLHKTGRLGTTVNNSDPSNNWYENEIKFFDGQVIPLAERVRSCKVFGVAAHVSLSNALANRREWIHMQKDIIVKDYVMDFRKKSAVHNVISTNVRRIPSINVQSYKRGDNNDIDNDDDVSSSFQERKSNDK